MARAIDERPVPQATSPTLAWFDIGRATRKLYDQVKA
jgi:hypothetical protein